MKKLFLFPLLLFALAAHSQSNKTDTIPYHFSWKNGWAVKMNLLQPITIGEFRLGIERRVSRYINLDILGSYYIPKMQFFYYGDEGNSFEGQYSGKGNYKIGLGLMRMEKIKNPIYSELIFCYRYYHDYRYDYTDVYPYVFNSGIQYNAFYFTKVFSLNGLVGKRVNINKFIIDFYGGLGLRLKYIRSDFNPVNSTQFSEVIQNWESDGIDTRIFYNIKLKTDLLPTIQMGINIGLTN